VYCAERNASGESPGRLLARQTEADAVPLHRRKPVRVNRGLEFRLEVQTERQLPGALRRAFKHRSYYWVPRKMADLKKADQL